jgi:hypothetical protein
MTALLLGGGGLAATVLASPLLASLAVLGATAPATPCRPEASLACSTATGSVAGPAPRGPNEALAAALSMVGTRGGWHRLCDRLVCRAYGYANSGYLTAAAHWTAMSRDALAHPGDRCPPPGSFAFWDTGPGQPGHVALVISRAGCNPHRITVVSNDVLDDATGSYGGIYHVTLARLEAGFVDPARYLGWSVPVCAGLALPTSSAPTGQAPHPGVAAGRGADR